MATKKTAKETARKRATTTRVSKARGAAANGLRAFSIHVVDPEGSKTLETLRKERSRAPEFGIAAAIPIEKLDPETAAKRYLMQALASDSVPQLVAPKVEGEKSEFRSLGTESMPLTNTKMVKFRQEFRKIPVYGSLVTVELDENNECVSVNSSLGEPADVDSVAKISPAQALKALSKAKGFTAGDAKDAPRLNYYFDAVSKAWHLVYVIEDVPVETKKKSQDPAPVLMDFVVDAHSGKIVAQLPRTPSLDATGVDELGGSRAFSVALINRRKAMRDETLNIETYDFAFRDPLPSKDGLRLPGKLITDPFSTGAVSAHANATVVATFLREVVMRNNIDNQGGKLVSSVQCLVKSKDPNQGKQWFNAFWNGRQMVYGQVLNGGKLRSLAASLDVVGHEMFHGVTDKTSRLEYKTESGALNESYSDIFGAIISNFSIPDIGRWNWEVGEGLSPSLPALRDMSDPSRFGQPMHMDNFQSLPSGVEPDDPNDFGFVHNNSGIHNFAAFRVITAKDRQGQFLFNKAQCAAIFYIALTQQLSRTSGFSDSRRGVLLAARSLFRNDPPQSRDAKIAGIEAGFGKAGIE